jgi:hypothetical protein
VTALYIAAEQGEFRVVEILLDQGANIEAWSEMVSGSRYNM